MSMADHTEPLQIAPDPATLHAFHRQQLSAMLDGELSPDEAKFMLRRLEHDVELARCWERWQVCGEVLRGRAERLLPGDFAARVAVAVQAPLPGSGTGLVNTRPPRARASLYWGGFGIAASLALVAAMALVGMPGNEDAPVQEGVVASTDNQVPEGISGVAMALVETAPASAVAEIPVPTRVEPAVQTMAAPIHSERAAQELLVPAVVPVLPRPWPRAGSGAGAFSVGYGPPPLMDPFQPRWAPPPSVLRPESGVQTVPVPGASRQD